MSHQSKTRFQLGILHFVLALLAFLALCAADAFGQTKTRGLPMTPGFAVYDFLNGRLGNAVFVGKHLPGDDVRQIPAANFVDLLASQNSALTILASHINSVPQNAAYKKMIRPNARRIVAFMTANEAVRNAAVSEFVSKAMRSSVTLPLSDMEFPVSGFGVNAALPNPARIIISSQDFWPKTTCGRDEVSGDAAFDRAILDGSALDSSRLGVEGLITGTILTDAVWLSNSRTGHFKSSKFDLVGDVGARQRSGISLKEKPLYRKTASLTAKKSDSNTSAAQTCTLTGQGYLGGCTGVSILFFTQTQQSQIARFDFITYAGNFTAANTARSFLIPSGCSSGGGVTIQEVRTNGTTCSYSYTGNLPHSRPCDQCGPQTVRLSAVHAATYGQNAAPESIIALFHEDFGASPPESASFLPLPFTLRGLSVQIGGQQAGLFYVSSTQINVMVPAGAFGLAPIVVTRPDGGLMYGDIPLFDSLPGLFTLNSSGTGLAATNIERRANETLLVLWGTGFNFFHGKPGYADTGRAEINLGGQWYEALYVGDSPGLVGVQQLNFAIPNVFATGTKGAFVKITLNDGRTWQTQGVDVRFP